MSLVEKTLPWCFPGRYPGKCNRHTLRSSSMKDHILLREIELFRNIAPEQIKKVLDISYTVKFSENETIMREGMLVIPCTSSWRGPWRW